MTIIKFFIQTGISIITRVPVKQQSLFKFLDGKVEIFNNLFNTIGLN